MNIAEKILKEINSKEGHDRINKFMQEYMADAKEQHDKAIKIVSTVEYITWLGNFTKKYEGFSDNKWLYCPEELSEQDNNFVQELHLFYDGIETYSSHNYIYPIKCDFGGFYKIKYDGIGFEIGRLIGQGTLFYCTRVEIVNEQEFIDFNDIMNNKEQDNVKDINKKLEELSKFVISVYEYGVPYDAICDVLGDILIKIKEGEKI